MVATSAPDTRCGLTHARGQLCRLSRRHQPDRLVRLLDGLDVTVERLAIVDNSGGSAAEADVHQALTELEQSGHPRVRQIAVARPFANAGVAMSWNLILRSFPSAPVAALLNNDVRIAPGILAEALGRVDCSRAQFLPLLPVPQEFSAFLLTPGCWDRIGLFDPDFHPAYCEDLDYGMRFIHDDVKRVLSLEHGYYHGTKKNDYSDGSQTWRSEPAIAQGVHLAHEMNKRYMHMKWSEAWQGHVEGETYKTPFNLDDMPVSFTTYDLDFVRRKHLGF